MIQGALSTSGNVNVEIAMSLFDKQIIPILTYGSTYWGTSDCYNKLYIHDIPENICTLKDLQSKLHEYNVLNLSSNFNGTNEYKVSSFRRIGKKSIHPRKILITMANYESKIMLLNSRVFKTENFTKSKFDTKLEQVQTKFCKFVLNTNKFTSNHAIRAELGKYPLHIYTDVKLIKYWHRLENMTDGSILKDAFNMCKDHNHSWYSDIKNCLDKYGLSYIGIQPCTYSEEMVSTELKRKLEGQYLQLWDSKSINTPKLEVLYKLKIDL